MARQQRSTTFAPESTRPIAQVALYARVSTLNNQDPEMQLAELREYAGRRGWQIVEEFTDQGVSGCKESRPALNRLMSDACRRRFDAVLIWKIDRFGRSLKHLVNALAELAALGVAFISLRDNLDLSTPSGRLMFQIIGAMAEFERALIQERFSTSALSSTSSSSARISAGRSSFASACERKSSSACCLAWDKRSKTGRSVSSPIRIRIFSVGSKASTRRRNPLRKK